MSAVPLPALVLAGTSDLPSSDALYLSAKAGPEKATAAANASVAYVVLVMVLSLPVDVKCWCQTHNKRNWALFPKPAIARQYFPVSYGPGGAKANHKVRIIATVG